MADKCTLNIEESSNSPSLTLKSDEHAGMRISGTSNVYLKSGYIDIQGGSGMPAIKLESGAYIDWDTHYAYPKTRADYGKTWEKYPDSTMSRLFTTRRVGAYKLVIHRETTSWSWVTPGSESQFYDGGVGFKGWESPQKSAINNVDGQSIRWEPSAPPVDEQLNELIMPACDVELYAVWEKTVEGSVSEVGSLTVQATPSDAIYQVAGTYAEGEKFFPSYGNQDFPLGTKVHLIAQENAQFEFVNWSVEGDVVISEEPEIDVVINGDRTIYANFREGEHVDEVVITKKVEGDLDSSVSAEPIEYVYVWGDEASVWGYTTVTPGYTAVDVYEAEDKTIATPIKIKVNPVATWYVVGEVKDAGKVTGYTYEAKAVSVEYGSEVDDTAHKIGSLPLGLGAGDDDGAVWMASAIRTDPDNGTVAMLPEVLPKYTFLNIYEKEEEEPTDPVIPEEFDVTITKKIEGIDPADLPDGTMFNFKFDSLDGKQNLGEVKFTKNDLLKGERSKPIGKLPKGFEITENGSSIPGYDVVVDVELKGIKSVEEGDEEGSLGSFEIDTVPFVPDVPTNRTRAVTPYEIIITNTYTPIDPSQQVPSDINMPQTGDESSILLWAGLMLLSGAAGMVLLRRKREA